MKRRRTNPHPPGEALFHAWQARRNANRAACFAVLSACLAALVVALALAEQVR